MQLETEQKALEINLDSAIYGAFAEIGAGQEVARYFFQAGAAAGTIAKTVSAYDKIVSDAIYGDEPSGRYVCESRLYKMLDHEFELMQARLRPCRENCNFFAFADTVSALNFQKTVRGDGWMGLRFQLAPDRAPNDLVLHIRMLDPDNRQQQQAVGILGVNMIYACFRYQNEPEKLVKSLLDSLCGRASVDMIRLSGPDFVDLDNRLLSLFLVKNGLSDVAIFGSDGRNLHASEFLYKKSILIARGSFRPPTRLQQDMITKSFAQFQAEPDVDAAKSTYLCEITLDNLMSSGQLDEQDFLHRADLLCALDQTVLISSCVQHKKLIAYFADYKIHRIGLAMGVKKLSNIIHETYEQNLDNLLAAFGQIFLRHVKFYIYPALLRDDQPDLMTVENMPVPESITFLFKHLVETEHIADIADFTPEFLHIYHKKVLQKIQSGSDDWASEVPRRVAKLIREKALFGFKSV